MIAVQSPMQGRARPAPGCREVTRDRCFARRQLVNGNGGRTFTEISLPLSAEIERTECGVGIKSKRRLTEKVGDTCFNVQGDGGAVRIPFEGHLFAFAVQTKIQGSHIITAQFSVCAPHRELAVRDDEFVDT